MMARQGALLIAPGMATRCYAPYSQMPTQILGSHWYEITCLFLFLSLDDSGVLVHCISGWDRTPLFVSLLRLSLWADGLCHRNLSPAEIIYLTIAYDWYLFGWVTGCWDLKALVYPSYVENKTFLCWICQYYVVCWASAVHLSIAIGYMRFELAKQNQFSLVNLDKEIPP